MNTIEINDELYAKLEAAAGQRKDLTVDQFVTELIQAGLENDEVRNSIYQQHDQEKIQQRLSALGYLE